MIHQHAYNVAFLRSLGLQVGIHFTVSCNQFFEDLWFPCTPHGLLVVWHLHILADMFSPGVPCRINPFRATGAKNVYSTIYFCIRTHQHCYRSGGFRYYPCFHKGLDCILSRLRLVRSSSSTHARSVVESEPYPTITDLGSYPADCPIFLRYYHWVRPLTVVS